MAQMHMKPAHTDEILENNRRRIRAGMRIMWLFLLIGLAAVVALLVWRNPTSMDKTRELPAQVAVTAVTILTGVVCIFYYGMKLAPSVAYRRYLRELQSGLSHEETGVVVRFDRHTSFREGLEFYQLIVNIGDLGDEKDERLFYWDASLPRPELEAGMKVRAMVHGNELIWLVKE